MSAPEPPTTQPSNPSEDTQYLLTSYTQLRQAIGSRILSDPSILPSPEAITTCLASLPSRSKPDYLHPLGPAATHAHLLADILPALNLQSLSPRYLGFVTGGVLPVAEAADNLVSALDQNVQVHFPLQGRDADARGWTHSASTAIEHAALGMLVDLFSLDCSSSFSMSNSSTSTTNTTTTWPVRTFTTGATASNILGLACARDAVLLRRNPAASVSQLGLAAAYRAAEVREIRVLSAMPHSSVGKAASVVGLGRASLRDVGMGERGMPWRMDLDKVEKELRMGLAEEEKGGGVVVHIVVVGAGEVNTGRFATGMLDMPKLRSLVDRYGGWIHVDGAFGLFARALPKTDEFLELHASAAGLELADSIAADGHKLLNVPYDSGIFLCRHSSIATQVFGNHNAAYLSSNPSSDHDPDSDAIISPLNVNLENSRRFRALPAYSVLFSEGREGIAAMLSRMVRLARAVARYIRSSPHYELLPRLPPDNTSNDNHGEDGGESERQTFIIVLFRAADPGLNETLVDRINADGHMFVSGTVWEGRKAARMAVASWRVDVERDAAAIAQVLDEVSERWIREKKTI